MHLHTHYVCHTPSNYNIITDRQAGVNVAISSLYRNYDIAIQKNPTIQGLNRWNSLPADILTCDSESGFKRLLKTHLFNNCFSVA